MHSRPDYNFFLTFHIVHYNDYDFLVFLSVAPFGTMYLYRYAKLFTSDDKRFKPHQLNYSGARVVIEPSMCTQ